MRTAAQALTSSLAVAFRAQLTKLPKRVRTMTLSEFATSFGGSVEQVMGVDARKAQSELNQWVAATPSVSGNNFF
jgi:hypothetical protein